MTQSPKIVHLDLLDTDYAKLAAGESFPVERRQRLAAEDYDRHDFERLGKQVARYRYGDLDMQGRDDILCSIGARADLFSRTDMEAFDDRLRQTGRFYLTVGERQQVINWLADELDVALALPSPPDSGD